MASYESQTILRVLLEMQHEYARVARRGQRRRPDADADEVDEEQLAAAVLFVKYLAARAGDVFLIGSAELLGLQADEIENRRWERTDVDLGIGAFRPPPPPDSLSYSSEDIARAVSVLDGYEHKGRIGRATGLRSGWIADAARFVKRLALETSDVGLIGGAEVFVLEEERRQRVARERAHQEDEEREREEAEEQARKWNEYPWVAESMLGDRLKPKLRGPDVKRLLELAGLTTKAGKKWVLTDAGVNYSNPERAKVGEPPPWPAWAKSVLAVLQSTLSKNLEGGDQVPTGTDSSE